MRSTYLQSLLAGLVMVIVTGCNAQFRQGPPGTIGVQRERAVLHDPFPRNDLGPPIVGGRPLGFELPQSETTAIQTSPWASRSNRGGPFQPRNGF